MNHIIILSVFFIHIIDVLSVIVVPGTKYGKGGMTWKDAQSDTSYSNKIYSDKKRNLEATICKLFPEVALVQDVSASYEPDMITLHRLMPAFLQFLSTEYSGYAKFGITSFVDKDVKGLGDEGDFCANMEKPLTRLSSPDILKEVQKALKNMVVGGGGDWLEGANMGMLRTAISDEIGWSTENYDVASNRIIKRVMIISTDAAMHDAPYHAQMVHANLPPNNLDLRRIEVTNDIDVACSKIDYPRPGQIADEFNRRGIIPIIFAGKPYSIQEDFKVPFEQWTETIKRYGEEDGPWSDPETGLASYYADFLSNVLNMTGVVHPIDMESKNFVEIFKAAMHEINIISCPDPTEIPGFNPSKPPAVTESSTESSNSSIPVNTEHPNHTETPFDTESRSEEATKLDEGTSPAVVIGSAAAGAVAGIVAIAALVKFFGFSGSGASVPGPNAISQDVTNVNSTVDREQFETVSGDLFA